MKYAINAAIFLLSHVICALRDLRAVLVRWKDRREGRVWTSRGYK